MTETSAAETAKRAARSTSGGPEPTEQLSLVRAKARGASTRPPEPVAAELPVARVAVDVPLAHLDRPFDYLVPEGMSESAVPGARVRVRFAGQQHDGFVLERVATSEHTGRMERLRRVVSAVPVLTPEVARLARLVADRYAGTLADVLRLAVPPRHARVETAAMRAAGPDDGSADDTADSADGPVETPAAPPDEAAEGPGDEAAPGSTSAGPAVDPGGWSAYPHGPGFLTALARGRSPRAVWSALPGADWPQLLARAVAATLASGRAALVVVPDARDVARMDAALSAVLAELPDINRARGPEHVVLTADLGPAERYRRWLAVLQGRALAVAGTRAAAFAPVRDLGLVVIWDDGDDAHVEPRAPYPHAREVLLLRSRDSGAGLLVGGFARTAEAAALTGSGWAHSLVAGRSAVRAASPRVLASGDDAELARDAAAASARLPTVAWEAARDGLRRGPVLVQVPRAGYVPGLSCAGCRSPARCQACGGPLSSGGQRHAPTCRWCGEEVSAWRCPDCGSGSLRARTVGSRRTAEELGRAFPGVPVVVSGRDGVDGVLATVRGAPALVVATPGAEPVADGGYAAALLLDGWALLARPDLRAGEETLRRWMAAAALVRPAASGGTVVVAADGSLAVVQALLRWDPVTAAERELADRGALGFPPAARVAGLTGDRAAVEQLLAATRLPAGAQVLGPVPLDGEGAPERPSDESGTRVRALVRVPRAQGAALAAELRAAQGTRSARRTGDPVRVQVDPAVLG